jgi:hypothetical protein
MGRAELTRWIQGVNIDAKVDWICSADTLLDFPDNP